MEAAGLINIYICSLGHKTVTINCDDGVTPFLIKCRGNWPGECSEMAQSSMYRVSQGLHLPQWCWYSPNEEEIKDVVAENLDHVKRGGLLLRRLDSATRGELAARFKLSQLRTRHG